MNPRIRCEGTLKEPKGVAARLRWRGERGEGTEFRVTLPINLRGLVALAKRKRSESLPLTGTLRRYHASVWGSAPAEALLPFRRTPSNIKHFADSRSGVLVQQQLEDFNHRHVRLEHPLLVCIDT